MPVRQAHGTWSEYVQGCRCQLCTLAARNYQRAYRKRNKEKLTVKRREYQARLRGEMMGAAAEQTAAPRQEKETVNRKES